MIRFLLLALLLAAPLHAKTGDRLDRSRLVPTFSDEFDRPLDFTRWRTAYGYEPGTPPARQRLNNPALNQDEITSDATVSQWPDLAVLEARKVQAWDTGTQGAPRLSAVLSTERSFSQRYGYFEAKIAAPNVPGLWPAFWLYDAPIKDARPLAAFGAKGATVTRNWNDEWQGGLNGEIDVVEGQTSRPREALHTASARFRWATVRGGERIAVPITKQSTSFKSATDITYARRYGVLWTAATITWYVDDVEVASMPNPGLNEPMYPLISIGAGGWDGNTVGPNFIGGQMLVDYVRVYSIK